MRITKRSFSALVSRLHSCLRGLKVEAVFEGKWGMYFVGYETFMNDNPAIQLVWFCDGGENVGSQRLVLGEEDVLPTNAEECAAFYEVTPAR